MTIAGRGYVPAAFLALAVGLIAKVPAADPQKQVVEMKLQTGERPTTDGIRGIFYRQQQWLYPSYKPRETLRREPEYRSAKPVYFAARYGDGEDTTFTLVIDESGGTGGGYDLVYVDADNDNRLDEKTERFPLRLGVSSRIKPLRVRLLVSAGGNPVPYHFDFRAFEYVHDRYPGHGIHANATNPSYYVGEALLGDKRRKVAVADLNSNGLFNDPPEQGRYTGDSLYVDLNGDGTFGHFMITSRQSQSEEFPYGHRYVCVNGRWYSLTATPDGTKMEIGSAESLMGTLAATKLAGSVILQSNRQTLDLDFSEGPARAMPGTYRLSEITLNAKDDSGASWKMYTRFSSEFEVKVQKGKTTRLPFGPPFQVGVDVARMKDSQSLNLTLKLTGAEGEAYWCPREERNKREARFEVRDKQGKVVFTDSFGFT